MADPRHVIATLTAAMNARDLEAFVACFHPDYTSDQPGFPDLEATLLDLIVEGAHLSSPRHHVTVYGKIDFELGPDGRIIAGRLYMPDLPQLGIWRGEDALSETP